MGASSAAAMNAKVAGKSGGQGNTQGTKALAALEGHYRCHVQNKATGQWFELQVNQNQNEGTTLLLSILLFCSSYETHILAAPELYIYANFFLKSTLITPYLYPFHYRYSALFLRICM